LAQRRHGGDFPGNDDERPSDRKFDSAADPSLQGHDPNQ